MWPCIAALQKKAWKIAVAPKADMTPDSESQLSTLTGARQTMLSWARVIESSEAVPAVYRSAHRRVAETNALFPYTVFAPAMANFRHKPTEKLLCEADDTLYIWERLGDQVSLTAYPLKDIFTLETGIILLFSWFTISGVTQAGLASTTTVEFNTATSRYFAPFLNKMRPAPGPDARARQVERQKFDYLAAGNFKLMNFAGESLVSGEKVLQTLLQPQIYKPGLTLGEHVFYQTTLSLAHLAILTDKEFILIQDDERSAETRGVRYGGKWQYVALRHISAVSVREQADGLLTLSLTLAPGGRQLEVVFAASQRPAVARLQAEMAGLAG
jgi:hypothetical protein